jgi:hypothetical protein
MPDQRSQRTLRHDEIEEKHRKEIPIPKRSDFLRNLNKAAKKSPPRRNAK